MGSLKLPQNLLRTRHNNLEAKRALHRIDKITQEERVGGGGVRTRVRGELKTIRTRVSAGTCIDICNASIGLTAHSGPLYRPEKNPVEVPGRSM